MGNTDNSSIQIFFIVFERQNDFALFSRSIAVFFLQCNTACLKLKAAVMILTVQAPNSLGKKRGNFLTD